MTDRRRTTATAPIVAAEVFQVEAALVVPYKLTEGILTHTDAVMLKLTDADGVEGWGEANPSSTFDGDTIGDVSKVLENSFLPAVLAESNPQPGSIDALLDSMVPKQLCAKGAVSMALLDILGKRLNVPAATLIGGAVRESLPVLWPLSNGTVEEDIEVIEGRLAQGFTSFMLKMGTSPIADEIRRVFALEARYGNRIKLIPDANQGWSREQAREFLAGIAKSNVMFVEQPLAKDDIAGMAMLAGETALALSADESVIGLAEAGRLASLSAARVFSIKSSKNGGPLRAQRIAAVAEAFDINCYMNSQIEFGISQAASLQHAVTVVNLVDMGHAFMSTLRLSEDPTNFSSFVRDGVVHLPSDPGLGIKVDETHVRRLSTASFRIGERR